MVVDKCKKCRRAGEKLFLKGEKCFGQKCPLLRKPYAPGKFGKRGKKRPTRGLSEYGAQLREKQKMKFGYGVSERQFANYLAESKKKRRDDPQKLLNEFLELRLDNIVFRLGFSESRAGARQIVSHGHITLNGKKVNIPSMRLATGDKIGIKPQSVGKNIFKDLDIKIKKYSPPSWLGLDKERKEGEILGRPL
jgi:small subunit ribosomal protein S4